MRTKAFIGVVAAAMLMFVIGCSNGSRTTAPSQSDTFSLSATSDDGAVRFEAGNETPTAQAYNPRIVTIYGKFLIDVSGCICVQTAWKEFTELSFPNGVPGTIPSGSFVQVRGEYLTAPGTHCQLDKHLRVLNIQRINPGL